MTRERLALLVRRVLALYEGRSQVAFPWSESDFVTDLHPLLLAADDTLDTSVAALVRIAREGCFGEGRCKAPAPCPPCIARYAIEGWTLAARTSGDLDLAPARPHVGSLCGFRVVVDETIPPDELRLVDPRSGRVLLRVQNVG